MLSPDRRRPDESAGPVTSLHAVTGERRLIYAYLVVLLVGTALSLLVFEHGRRVSEQASRLADADVPTLRALHRLDAGMKAIEPTLYAYYLTTDREAFTARLQRLQHEVAGAWTPVTGAFAGRPEHGRIAQLRDELTRRAGELDEVMAARPLDWDAARAVLADVPGLAAESESVVSTLVDGIQRGVTGTAIDIRRDARTTTAYVVAFSLSSLVVALFVGHFVRLHLRDAHERRRLALFPERNPDPILSLDLQDRVLYANPGARALAAELFGSPNTVAALLPAALVARLRDSVDRSGTAPDLEHRIAGRTLRVRFHCFPDLGASHLYLADVTVAREAIARVEHLAYHHPLTNLPNRQAFLRDAPVALEGDGGAVVVLAGNRLAHVNGQFGHVAADHYLHVLAGRFSRWTVDLRDRFPGAALYHVDGERFITLLPGLVSSGLIPELTGRLAELVERPVDVSGVALHARIGGGVALHPLHGADPATLLRNATAALDAGRHADQHRLVCFDQDLQDAARERLAIEQSLREAVRAGDLTLVYQPQVDATSGAVIGVEALVRWTDRDRGAVSPGIFIPIAEASGLIVGLGDWVLRQACRQAEAWRQAGHPVRVAVNISAIQVEVPDFAARVAAVLRESGLPAQWLELEVTEGIAMQGLDRTVRMLGELRALGLTLAMDDFGTGYSSLGYLTRFPLDKLKVDQSFVRHMVDDPGAAAVTRAVIALGRSLGLRVIAEGVESDRQIELLVESGCHELQGYRIGRPLDPGATEAYIVAGRRKLPATALRARGP